MSPKKAAKKVARKPKKKPEKAAPKKKAAAKPPPRAAPPPPPVLRPVPLYEFTAGGLRGFVRLTDPDRGIEFSRAEKGKALPARAREVLSLRHYLATGHGGLLVPREEAACEGKVVKQGVSFRYQKTRDWPVDATATYELLAEGGLDVTLTFGFAQRLRSFEAGLGTLMPMELPSIYVHSGGRWVQAAGISRVQRFYPRNLAAAELIADGRWNGLRMAGIGLAVEPRGYDYPIVVLREERSRWALIYMALTEECSAVWVNGADRHFGLGLIGADVQARSSATCRLRVLFRQAEELNDVLPCYREFVQEARTTRKR